jgi:hypothetical protein
MLKEKNAIQRQTHNNHIRLLRATLIARKTWNDVIQLLRERNCHPKILYPT